MRPHLCLHPFNPRTVMNLRKGDNSSFHANKLFTGDSPRFDGNDIFNFRNPRHYCLNNLYKYLAAQRLLPCALRSKAQQASHVTPLLRDIRFHLFSIQAKIATWATTSEACQLYFVLATVPRASFVLRVHVGSAERSLPQLFTQVPIALCKSNNHRCNASKPPKL